MTSRGSFEFTRADILSGGAGIGRSLSRQRLQQQQQEQLLLDAKLNNVDKHNSSRSYAASIISSSSTISTDVLSNNSLALMTPELLRLASGEGGMLKKTWSFRSNNSDIKSTSSESMSITGSSSYAGSCSPHSSITHHSKRNSRANIHLDPIDTSSVGSGKSRPSSLRTTPKNMTSSTASSSEPMVYSVTWSDGGGRSSSSSYQQQNQIQSIQSSPMSCKEDDISCASPTTITSYDLSSTSSSPKNLDTPTSSSIPTSSSSNRLSSYLFNMKNYTSSPSSSSASKTPNNRLPPMTPSSTRPRSSHIYKAESPTPGSSSAGKRPDLSSSLASSSKPRPLSARMSSLISIFSRSESMDAVARVISPTPSPPRSPAISSSSSRISSSSTSRRSSSSRKTSSSMITSSVSYDGGMIQVRNLDTGQVINLDHHHNHHHNHHHASSSYIPSTIPPTLLMMKKGKAVKNGTAMMMAEPSPLPPLFRDIQGVNDNHIERTL